MNDEVLSLKKLHPLHKCVLSKWRLAIGGQTIPIPIKLGESGLNYSCSFHIFGEHTQIAKASKLVKLLHRTFKLNRSRLMLFKTRQLWSIAR